MAASSLACFGCPSGTKEPLPREETSELASAAPHALGALAGGTDAAPPAVFAPPPSDEIEGLPIPELEADGGPDGADAGVGSEELPL
ncbi:MAG TPA: hypothetical protein VFZ53_09225 [Polyangiaceae bacterium]